MPRLQHMLDTGAFAEGEDHESDDGGIGPDDLGRFIVTQTCEACGGVRLRPEALAVKLGGRTIAELSAMPLRGLREFLSAFASESALAPRESAIALPLIKAVTERLGFLLEVGLDYLSLERTAHTLSGGEGQRIRLATQIGASLVGVLYVLDEPSIGLHARDNARLLQALRRLVDKGNSVLVVEHDRDAILVRRPRGRHGSGRGRARRADRRAGHGRRDHEGSQLDHRAVSLRRKASADPVAAPSRRASFRCASWAPKPTT